MQSNEKAQSNSYYSEDLNNENWRYLHQSVVFKFALRLGGVKMGSGMTDKLGHAWVNVVVVDCAFI